MNYSKNAKILSDYFQDHRQTIIQLLKELVLIESPTPEPEPQRKIFQELSNHLSGIGYQTQIIPGTHSGGCLFARPQKREKGARLQLLLGHSDTVWPLGTLENMPFEEKNKRISGPGVFDMKAGLVQIIFALKALSELKVTPYLTPTILITSDEETGSYDARNTIERIARHVDRVYVLEPALGPLGNLKTTRKGVWHFRIDVHGRAAHAGINPNAGASAILELSHLIQKLFSLNDPQKGISVNVGTVQGGVRRNVIAGKASAEIDVRALSLKDGERIEKTIRSLQSSTPGVALTIQGGINHFPMEPTPRSQALWQMAKKMGNEMGLAVKQGTSGGASDGSITSQITATIDGLGPVGDGAHADHEYIDIEKTIERFVLLSLMLLSPLE